MDSNTDVLLEVLHAAVTGGQWETVACTLSVLTRLISTGVSMPLKRSLTLLPDLVGLLSHPEEDIARLEKALSILETIARVPECVHSLKHPPLALRPALHSLRQRYRLAHPEIEQSAKRIQKLIAAFPFCVC